MRKIVLVAILLCGACGDELSIDGGPRVQVQAGADLDLGAVEATAEALVAGAHAFDAAYTREAFDLGELLIVAEATPALRCYDGGACFHTVDVMAGPVVIGEQRVINLATKAEICPYLYLAHAMTHDFRRQVYGDADTEHTDAALWDRANPIDDALTEPLAPYCP